MPTGPYREVLLANLADPVEAEHYLNAVLEDYPAGFLKARNVAQARQMTKVAQDAGIQRESFYRALSDDGNPTLETLTAVLSAVGLRISIATASEGRQQIVSVTSHARRIVLGFLRK